MSSGPENKFRKKIVEALRRHFGAGVYVQKNHGSAFSAGLVDMEVVLRGVVRFYELKAGPGGLDPKSVTALQRHTLHLIDAAGGSAYVLHLNTSNEVVALYHPHSLGDVKPVPLVWTELGVALADPVALRATLYL